MQGWLGDRESRQPSLHDYSSLHALNGLTSLQAIAALQGAANLAQARPQYPQLPSAYDILSASKQVWPGHMSFQSMPICLNMTLNTYGSC